MKNKNDACQAPRYSTLLFPQVDQTYLNLSPFSNIHWVCAKTAKTAKTANYTNLPSAEELESHRIVADHLLEGYVGFYTDYPYPDLPDFPFIAQCYELIQQHLDVPDEIEI